MSFWDKILTWLGLKPKKKIKQSVYPTKPSEVKGYGPCNAWYMVNPEVLGDALVAAKCNTTIVEFLGWAATSKHEDIASLKEPWKKFIKAMRDRKIMVYCILVNWTKGKKLNGDSGKSICDGKYNSDWFISAYDIVAGEGVDGVCLEACSEWADANQSCTSKAQGFVDYVAKNWTGLKGWNKGSRPKSAPAGYWLNYHINRAQAEGPAGCINTTDTSNVLREINAGGDVAGLADPSKLEACARTIRNSGRGFIYFGFGHTTIDTEAIKALGKV